MKIKGDFPFSLDIEDKFEAIVELKIDKRDYSPYLDIYLKRIDKTQKMGI